MFLLSLFSLVRNVRKTTNPKIWAGVLEEIPLAVVPSAKGNLTQHLLSYSGGFLLGLRPKFWDLVLCAVYLS